jgi:lipoate---protein ligase
MRWRLIDYSENDAFMNMAIDEAVSEAVGSGDSPPTIRFYGWNPAAVSLGYFQSIAREINPDRCVELGVDVVRRRTGGGAVFHDPDGEITYSVIAKEQLFPKDIIASYRDICGCIIHSLGLLGIQAEFKPINDIIVSGKKISGNAQTRRSGVLLQHGTVLFSVDVEKMFSILRVPDEKIKDKLIADARERVTSIRQQRNKSWEETYEALVEGFTNGREIELGRLTESECARAEELASSRYRKKEWNWMR